MADRPPEDRALTEWTRRVTQALQILDLDIDPAILVDLANRTSSSVSPSAGPISTFAVGYAAGQATRNGRKASNAAVRSAADVVLQLSAEGDEERPERTGWTDTGQ